MLLLLDPTIENQRVWAVTEPYCWNDVVRAILKVKPDALVDEQFFGEFGEMPPRTVIDNNLAQRLMEPYGGLKSLEVSIREALAG